MQKSVFMFLAQGPYGFNIFVLQPDRNGEPAMGGGTAGQDLDSQPTHPPGGWPQSAALTYHKMKFSYVHPVFRMDTN
jgi:hypothetical protein